MGTASDPVTDLPRPFGPFTLVRLIAQGGMGQVFLALRRMETEAMDEVCVVKTVRTDLRADREAVARFLDEARVVQRLDHAAICHTLDAGLVDDSYFLALEFISGRNLRDMQTRAQHLGRTLPDAVIFHVILQVLDALHYAHMLVDPETGSHLGIVHRDISPHNVMLGFDGYAKLIDFGLADHQLKRELTRPGIMVGKLRYNAPEQVRDRALDGRSDLYSVGVVLYELVVGERFYEGLTEDDIWRVAMKGTHRPRALSALPTDLREILEVALAPNPLQRFTDAAAMREAIERLMRGRDLREGRRSSSRWMTELFAEERREERDMILQATGMAEARTRLINARGSVGSAGMALQRDISAVGRTRIVSPAQVRDRLSSIMSGFDPDADTMLPQEPDIDREREAGQEGAAFIDPDTDKLARSARGHGRSVGVKDIEPDPPRQRTVSPARSSAPRTRRDSGDRRPLPPLAPPAEGRFREHTRSGTSGDVPPPRGRAATVVALVLLAFLLTGVGMMTLLPPLLTGARPRIQRAPHAEVAVKADEQRLAAAQGPREPAAAVVPATDASAAPPDDRTDDHTEDRADDHTNNRREDRREDRRGDRTEERTEERTSDADPGSPKVEETPRADEPKGATPSIPPPTTKAPPTSPGRQARSGTGTSKQTKASTRSTPMSAPREPPPVGELRTLKERVGYLKTWCLDRVPCARSTTDSAARIASLSAEETRALLADLERCVRRCAP